MLNKMDICKKIQVYIMTIFADGYFNHQSYFGLMKWTTFEHTQTL